MTTNYDFIPPADTPHTHHESVIRDEHDTVWENPLATDVKLHLHIGTTPVYGAPENRRPLSMEQRTGIRTYVIPAKSSRAIPVEFDKAIQDTICSDPMCMAPKYKCRDKSHPRTIVGGLGPYLINRGAQVRPKLHPSLDSLQADKRAAEEAAIKALQERAEYERRALVAEGNVELKAKELAAREAELSAREKRLAEAEAAANKKK